MGDFLRKHGWIVAIVAAVIIVTIVVAVVVVEVKKKAQAPAKTAPGHADLSGLMSPGATIVDLTGVLPSGTMQGPGSSLVGTQSPIVVTGPGPIAPAPNAPAPVPAPPIDVGTAGVGIEGQNVVQGTIGGGPVVLSGGYRISNTWPYSTNLPYAIMPYSNLAPGAVQLDAAGNPVDPVLAGTTLLKGTSSGVLPPIRISGYSWPQRPTFLGRSTEANESDCVAKCFGNPGCQVYAYGGGQCMLYQFNNTSGALSGLISDVIGLPMKDTEIVGNDLYNKTVNSVVDCQGMCHGDANCQLYTYYPADSSCHIKGLSKNAPGAIIGAPQR